MAVCFINKGHLDIRALTTFGVSVKSEGSIGYFGTGFKYALATLLRNGQQVRVYAGDAVYHFEAKPATIRGQDFNLIHMSVNGRKSKDIGLTTQAGRDWTMLQAYRELYSNCVDEGGEIQVRERAPRDVEICVMVTGAEFEHTHAFEADKIILNTKGKRLLFSNNYLEIYEGGSTQFWYKGIAVFSLNAPSHFTYNFTEHMDLTEDRTLRDPWYARSIVRDAILESNSKAIIYPAILGDKTTEARLDWQYSYAKPSEVFKDVVRQIRANPSAQVADSALALFYKNTDEVSDVFKIVTLTAEQKGHFNTALAKLKDAGLVPGIENYQFVFVEKLAKQSGEAFKGKIIIADTVCCEDSRELLATILEEYMHLELKVQDCTRNMQNALFDVITLLLNR
jgi:hypothetical protein